jgi:hypothetical protein
MTMQTGVLDYSLVKTMLLEGSAERSFAELGS